VRTVGGFVFDGKINTRTYCAITQFQLRSATTKQKYRALRMMLKEELTSRVAEGTVCVVEMFPHQTSIDFLQLFYFVRLVFFSVFTFFQFRSRWNVKMLPYHSHTEYTL
jgi:hypothetical protein